MDRRSLSESHQHRGRCESVDSKKSGLSYVSRREVQLSPVTPQATEKRTITVIPSLPRPAGLDGSAGVTGRTDSATLADSAGVTGPTDSAEAQDSAGDESAGDHDLAVADEPEIVDDSAGVADPAQEQEQAGADSAQPQDSAVDDSAKGDGPVAQGTPAGTTPAAGQDTSMVSDVSRLLFPSLPRNINQATLLDFMSMMTLMQWRMDSGMPVPVTQSRPVDQTPTTRDDQTPPRRSRTPVRRSRTPVRHSRGRDDSRDSTRSRSPIRRSSSSDSLPRDASPVDFSAALDTEEKVKDRSISDEEDKEGSQRKVSAAQYQLFRQTVTSSKGTFKVNPTKSRRAPRASLMDLGESEVTDRVSWLDQPSLVDTMASTARIAQGLKEDEEVEKTTLSETLSTSSSNFKHLTVKQVFPREPYRLKVHRDAQYLPKPPAENGFSDSKAPSSYQILQSMCLNTEELAQRLAIYASLVDSMVASVREELSPKDQRSKLLREKLAIIQEAQVSAILAGFAAASNLQLLRQDVLLKKFGFQPQVLSTVRTAPFKGPHVLGPEPKELQNRVRAIRQADKMAG